MRTFKTTRLKRLILVPVLIPPHTSKSCMTCAKEFNNSSDDWLPGGYGYDLDVVFDRDKREGYVYFCSKQCAADGKVIIENLTMLRTTEI